VRAKEVKRNSRSQRTYDSDDLALSLFKKYIQKIVAQNSVPYNITYGAIKIIATNYCYDENNGYFFFNQLINDYARSCLLNSAEQHNLTANEKEIHRNNVDGIAPDAICL